MMENELLDFAPKEKKKGGPISRMALIELGTILTPVGMGLLGIEAYMGLILVAGQILILLLMPRLSKRRWPHVICVSISIAGWLVMAFCQTAQNDNRLLFVMISTALIILGFLLEAVIEKSRFSSIGIVLVKLGYVLSLLLLIIFMNQAFMSWSRTIINWIGLAVAGCAFIFALLLNSRQQSTFLANRVFRIMMIALFFGIFLSGI